MTTVQDWQTLADQLGPQTAPYQFDADWFDDDGTFKLRTIRCRCGAAILVIDEGEAIPTDMYLCDSCTLREAFTMEADWACWYWPRRLIEALRHRLSGMEPLA